MGFKRRKMEDECRRVAQKEVARKRPGINPGPSSFRLRLELIVNAAHATTRHSRGPAVLLRSFGDHGFRIRN
jgi:hypothetical protein